MHHSRAAAGAIAILLSGLALGGEFTFEVLVDSTTPAPGGAGTFSFFGRPALDDAGNLVFHGYVDPSGGGLYTTVGGSLRLVADAATPIPGQDTTFSHGFRSSSAAIDDGVIAFYAFTEGWELGGGVYCWRDGVIEVVADMSMAVPGGTGTFNAIEDSFGFGPFSDPAIDGGEVAFRAAADWPRQRGVYIGRPAGGLDVVANLEMPVPGGTGNFSFLSAEISLEGGAVAFRGEGFGLQRGIYANLEGPLAKIADKTDPIPGGTGTFTSVTYPWLSGGRIIFAGEGADGQQGIYLWDAGTLSVVVDRTTPVPGGTGTFSDFAFNWSQPTMSGGRIAFRAVGPDGREGIYLKECDVLKKVIDTADLVDGKRVQSVSMGSHCIGGEEIAFQAGFADGSSAIVAARPAPAILFTRGDANADGNVDLSDIAFSLIYLFRKKYEPPCLKSVDVDDDGALRIDDPVYLLKYLFCCTAAPPRPFPECGADGTADKLSCVSYPSPRRPGT